MIESKKGIVTKIITVSFLAIFVSTMNNIRFATLIHILTLLAKSPGQWLSSDWISESIQINPVMVRKELGVLKELGWVTSKTGILGGSMLRVSSSEISLADIYKVVKTSNVLGRKNNCDGSKCPVGKGINRELEKLFEETDQIVLNALVSRTLKSFVDQFD